MTCIQEAKKAGRYFVMPGADGRGYLTDEGFVVLAKSSGRRENAQSINGTADERFRQRLIDAGVLQVEAYRRAPEYLLWRRRADKRLAMAATQRSMANNTSSCDQPTVAPEYLLWRSILERQGDA